ncbi:MAG: ABC transporter substrate-binding protein [Bacteroidales bacterium]|nr:ABC transporter substrate-binding protein [Bacteroidales bacterium]
MKYLSLIFPLLLLSCTHHSHDDKQIFRYNESAGIATLDPAFAKDQSIIWPCRQLYNGLIQLDTALQVQPCIAKRWTVSTDGLTYTFILRDDVYFHKNALFTHSSDNCASSSSPKLGEVDVQRTDGGVCQDSTRRVVADDFVYSFNRILDPSVASPGAWIFRDVERFEATNDTTFVIRLKSPFAPFLTQLGMVYCSVVPREVVEHYGKDFRNHPCGTGPFQFQYWKEGVKLVLRQNPHYFEGSPYLDAVAVTFIVDKQTVFLEFVKGNLDFMNSLDASYKDEILNHDGTLKAKYASRIDMVSTPFLNTEYLGFNMTAADGSRILQDKRIRQAINYGFDRRKMMQYLRNNIGAPGVGGFVPLGLPGYDTLPTYGYEYNPEKAKRLLAEAGYPNGIGLPKLKLATTSSYLDLCKYIQQQLGLIGIDVQVDVNPPAALREQIAQGKSQWFRGSWIADYPDAENYLSLFYSPNHSPAGPNYTRFTSKHFDKLYEQARRCTDPVRRVTLYHQMDSIVMQEAPVIVLYYDQILHFTHKNITGLRSDGMNTLDLRRVRKN